MGQMHSVDTSIMSQIAPLSPLGAQLEDGPPHLETQPGDGPPRRDDFIEICIGFGQGLGDQVDLLPVLLIHSDLPQQADESSPEPVRHRRGINPR